MEIKLTQFAVGEITQLRCKKAWQREQQWQDLTSCWLSFPQSPVQQCFCRRLFPDIAAPTARLKLSPCDCCDPGVASLQDAFWRRTFTKWHRSYEMSAEGTELRVPNWKQALLLFINKCNLYLLFTWCAEVYWALYPRWATFLHLLFIYCNFFWSVMVNYYSMFCLQPCSISRAWLSRL